MDLYCRLGNELRSLFKDLFDPKKCAAVRAEMKKILALADQIGGVIKKKAEELNNDVNKFLAHPDDPKLIAIMKKHALLLDQETREL